MVVFGMVALIQVVLLLVREGIGVMVVVLAAMCVVGQMGCLPCCDTACIAATLHG